MGTGNVQNNAWAIKPPPDPEVLAGLSPHAAVARLRQLSHDELVEFFVKASPREVAEILVAFLKADSAKIVAILGDLKSQKATELLKAVSVDATMRELPEAAAAIDRKAASLKWTDSEPLERFDESSEGYVRKYKNGRVFCSYQGVHPVSGLIERYWVDNKELLEFPCGDEELAEKSPYGVLFKTCYLGNSVHGGRI